MARRRRWLQPGEAVLYASRRHPVVLARPIGAALVAIGAAAFGFVAWASAPAWFGVLLGALVVVVGARVLVGALRWRAGLLVITTARIAQREGVLRRVGREIPVGRVEDVTVVQGLAGRVLGYGEVTVESAGAAPARPFRAVRRPEDVQHAIHRASTAARHPLARGARRGAGGAAEVADDLDEQLELLDQLYRRGFLSAEELEDKRLEVLGAPAYERRPPPGADGGRW